MAQQIQSVVTFADSGANAEVNGARLNSHVNDAALLNGAVIGQIESTAPLAADTVLLGDSTAAATGVPKKVQIGNLLLQAQRDGTQRWGGTAGGTANALTVATSPVSAGAYVTGETIRFKTSAANTGAATLNIDGRGNANLYSAAPAVLVAGALPNGAVIEAVYDGTQFQCVSISNAAGSVASVQAAEAFRGDSQQYVLATGTANAIAAAPLNSAGAASYTALITGMTVKFKAANTNTGATTLAVNGLVATAVFSPSGVALLGGEIRTGTIVHVVYDGTQFIMVGAAPAAFTSTQAGTLASSKLTTAHGLGKTPSKVRAVFICTTNQSPFVIGDELDFANVINDSGNSFPVCNFWANATNIVTSIYDTSKLNVATASTTSIALTAGSWKIKVYAEV